MCVCVQLLNKPDLLCCKDYTMMQTPLFIAISTLLLAVCKAENNDHYIHFEENYLVGMRAYTMEEWVTCVEKMEQAVKDFERFQEGSLKCLRKCDSQPVSLLALPSVLASFYTNSMSSAPIVPIYIYKVHDMELLELFRSCMQELANEIS